MLLVYLRSPVTYVDNAELTARLPEQEVSLIYIYNKDQPETANHVSSVPPRTML